MVILTMFLATWKHKSSSVQNHVMQRWTVAINVQASVRHAKWDAYMSVANQNVDVPLCVATSASSHAHQAALLAWRNVQTTVYIVNAKINATSLVFLAESLAHGSVSIFNADANVEKCVTVHHVINDAKRH